ncbi:helix-loop-helix protein delilah-like [Macrobrachium rosenbergii]|uniref:helix-loop-helix protein delilah-like n=1 Tax=Macrobrachium rosenbergii TaxID=79674 RepID=UPI0034D3E496
MENLELMTSDKEHFPDNNNNNSNGNNIGSDSGRSGEKYGLRPRTAIKRLHHDLPFQELSKRSGKSKPRPAPLSKYRRKTANARERHRMKAINSAFESLRKVLPDAVEVHTASSTMTKITTLRLAVDYIRALTDVLGDDSDPTFPLQSREDDAPCHGISSSMDFSQMSPASTPYTVPVSMCQNHRTDLPVDVSSSPLPLHYKTDMTPQYTPQLTQLMSYCSTSNDVSASCSPSTSRGSLGSTSDLEELLSDDSGLLEDSLDVFHDIPTITLADPFEVLLDGEKEGLISPF